MVAAYRGHWLFEGVEVVRAINNLQIWLLTLPLRTLFTWLVHSLQQLLLNQNHVVSLCGDIESAPNHSCQSSNGILNPIPWHAAKLDQKLGAKRQP